MKTYPALLAENSALKARCAELAEALESVMACFVGERNAENCLGGPGVAADKARAALAGKGDK